MKLARCPESGPANWAENLNKKLLREGLGPVGSHRVPPNPIWDPRREELGPTEPNLGPTVEKSSDRVPPNTYQDTCKVGGFEGTILGLENAHASGFNIVCLYRII